MSTTDLNYDAVSSVLTFFILVAGVATVIIYHRQLQAMRRTLDQMTTATKAEAASRLSTKLSNYNQVEIDHPLLRGLWDSPETSDESTHHIARLLTNMRFAVLEEAFLQRMQYHTMDQTAWDAWERIITRWIRRPFFPSYWKAHRGDFGEDFSACIDTLLARQSHDDQSTPPAPHVPTGTT